MGEARTCLEGIQMSAQHANLDITDPALFGNEAGEDEDPDVLKSYFVPKPEFERFWKAKSSLAIVRARKGMGKSALLAKLGTDLKSEKQNVAAVIKGSDLAAFGPMDGANPNQLINEWQQRLCATLVYELGKRLKIAFSDTSIAMVESAELAGFKSKNIVGSLLERIRVKVGDVEFTRPERRDTVQLLRRHLENRQVFAWIIVDDIDATFVNSPQACLQISTFFSACRRITADVANLAVRVSVRSDVWSVVKRTDEALDKCEQYMVDIAWSTDEARRLLVKKVSSYIQRTPGLPKWVYNVPFNDMLALVFNPLVRWGDNEVPVDRPIHILSAGRPRWAAQLCKMAAEQAATNQRSRIGIQEIKAVLNDYGRFRLDDLYREHSHQYPGLQRLIESFAGGPRRYSTAELLEHVSRRVIKIQGLPEIDGATVVNGALDVGRFLFKIGFIHARDDANSSPRFVRFEDRMDLLTTTANLDDGLSWEIHPSYRTILRISTTEKGIGP